MIDKDMIRRLESLEQVVYGAVQEPFYDTCTWDLKDNIPVTHCRPERYIPKWAVERVDVMAFCPFCSSRIEVVK